MGINDTAQTQHPVYHAANAALRSCSQHEPEPDLRQHFRRVSSNRCHISTSNLSGSSDFSFWIFSTVLFNLRMLTIPPCLWTEILSGSTKPTVRCSFRLFTFSKRFEEAEYSQNITFFTWHFQLFSPKFVFYFNISLNNTLLIDLHIYF